MGENIKFRYNRGAYPGLAPALSPTLSRHHIISYPFMMSFSVVTYYYLATAGSNEEWQLLTNFFNARDAVIPNKTTIRNNFSKENLEASVNTHFGELNRMSWAESNLFIGPNSSYRGDDPSQKRDECPVSLADKKLKADDLLRIWTSVSSSKIVGAADKTISINIEDRNLLAFCRTFLTYINAGTSVYHTKYSDWCVTCESGRHEGNYPYYIPKTPPTELESESFKFSLRNARTDLVSHKIVSIALGDRAMGVVKDGDVTADMNHSF